MSDVTWLLMSMTYSSWFLWGILRQDPFLLATNLVGLPGSLWIVTRLWRDGRITKTSATATLAAGSTLLALQFAAGAAGAFAAVVLLTLIVRGAQIRTALRAPSIAGVSAYPWAISAVSQCFWLAYGLLSSDPVLAAHAPVAIAANIALLSVLHRRKGAARRPQGRPSSTRVGRQHRAAAGAPEG